MLFIYYIPSLFRVTSSAMLYMINLYVNHQTLTNNAIWWYCDRQYCLSLWIILIMDSRNNESLYSMTLVLTFKRISNKVMIGLYFLQLQNSSEICKQLGSNDIVAIDGADSIHVHFFTLYTMKTKVLCKLSISFSFK